MVIGFTFRCFCQYFFRGIRKPEIENIAKDLLDLRRGEVVDQKKGAFCIHQDTNKGKPHALALFFCEFLAEKPYVC